jgi:hypothetical protein
VLLVVEGGDADRDVRTGEELADLSRRSPALCAYEWIDRRTSPIDSTDGRPLWGSQTQCCRSGAIAGRSLCQRASCQEPASRACQGSAALDLISDAVALTKDRCRVV